MEEKKGLLVVISGPSGAGKGTVVKELFKREEQVVLSISATTRNPRVGEQNGKDYFFIEKKEFENMIDDGEILEYTTYCENYYGTPKKYVMDNINAGNDVILEIEVDGKNQIVEKYADTISIFLTTKNYEVLRDRLVGRNTEDEKTIEKRLNKAHIEMDLALDYDYIVINDELDECVNDVISILKAEKNKAKNREKFVKEVFFNV